MNDEFRQMVVETLVRGDDLPADWARELFPPARRECELVYHGKERKEDVLAETLAVPLQPASRFGKHGNEWHNQLIFGDNLQAMKTLLEMKEAGSLINADGTSGIRVVYIDPPFATRRDFQSTQDEKAYQDKILGARFIEFIRRRLVFIRELLTTNGSLFFHTDQRKGHYIKLILDEVFGEQNFRNEIILPGRASKNIQQQFDEISRLNVRHDTLLWYSASPSTRFAPLWVEKHKMEHPEGRWHHFWSNADRPSMRYKLLGIVPRTGQWTWRESRALKAVANYERFIVEGGGRTLLEYWRDTGSTFEFIRKSPDDDTPQYWREPADTRLADTVWSGVRVYNNSMNYPTEKHEVLLRQVLELSSSPGDLVLDAFAGSGTTCAAAEKLGRRWIAIDCGKLSIYTIQKRLLNLRSDSANKGAVVTPKPFTLYAAGLYDFTTLKQLPWNDWRFFALQLFGSKDEPHEIGGLTLDGKLKGASVLVFNHFEHAGQRIDEDTVRDIHAAIGKKIGNKLFIIAPRGVFDFQQDYLLIDGVRYYALRIPYSVVADLHQRQFTALQQPSSELAVNETVDAVGFDFIQPPRITFGVATKGGKYTVTIKDFESRAKIRGKDTRGGFETLSMVMVDFNYDGQVFDLDAAFYADQIKANDWTVEFMSEGSGEKIMIVFIDIYGNESREVIEGAPKGKSVASVMRSGSKNNKLPKKAKATSSKKGRR